jgi:hypothetical protein
LNLRDRFSRINQNCVLIKSVFISIRREFIIPRKTREFCPAFKGLDTVIPALLRPVFHINETTTHPHASISGMASQCHQAGRDPRRPVRRQGFEVAVVRDATAGPRVPEGDGYLAALINYRFLAHALWTTEETVGQLAAR